MTFTEIFFTLVVIWILFRILRSERPAPKGNTFTFHTHHHHKETKREGETTVHRPNSKSAKDLKGGEYVDYEEIKD